MIMILNIAVTISKSFLRITGLCSGKIQQRVLTLTLLKKCGELLAKHTLQET